jgi:hypothetical protein
MKLLGKEAWAVLLKRRPFGGRPLPTLPSTRTALHQAVVDTQGFPIKTLMAFMRHSHVEGEQCCEMALAEVSNRNTQQVLMEGMGLELVRI